MLSVTKTGENSVYDIKCKQTKLGHFCYFFTSRDKNYLIQQIRNNEFLLNFDVNFERMECYENSALGLQIFKGDYRFCVLHVCTCICNVQREMVICRYLIGLQMYRFSKVIITHR